MSDSDPSTGLPERGAPSPGKGNGPSQARADRPRRAGVVLAVLLAGLALILAGGGVGAGYWAWLQMRAGQARIAAEQSATLTRIRTLQAQLRDLAPRTQLEALQGRLGQRLDRLQAEARRQAETVAALQQALSRSQTLARRTPERWQLAEVEYLLAIARYQLDLMHDARGSLAALEAADRRLAALGDPALLPVRERLAKEMAALRHYHAPDRVGILLALSQLLSEAAALTPAAPKPVAAPSAAAPAAPAAGGWRGMLDRIWSPLASQIVVRHSQPSTGEKHAADVRQVANRVLELYLEAAAQAAVQQDQAGYRRALTQAMAWLKAHYPASAARPLQAQLAELYKRPVSATPPPLGDALTALQKFLSQKSAAS